MNIIRARVISRIQKQLNQLSTIIDGDSYWTFTERLLTISNCKLSRADFSAVVLTFLKLNDARKLHPGENLLAIVLKARMTNLVLRKEFDSYARRVMNEERELHDLTWSNVYELSESMLTETYFSETMLSGSWTQSQLSL